MFVKKDTDGTHFYNRWAIDAWGRELISGVMSLLADNLAYIRDSL